MSDFGLIATRLDATTDSLRHFSNAIEYFRSRPQRDQVEVRARLSDLLRVLEPITAGSNGKLSESLEIDELSMITILKQMHPRDWQPFRIKLNDITDKVRSSILEISIEDLAVLEDVADAMDAECARLFKRISGRV